ncbi:MAG: TonB-dependent receptor plug domain-containing protein [Bacteroidales bacterium]|nr:TonB-dependent receptor plug domain-containing protein [Bacteroidales bacterium]
MKKQKYLIPLLILLCGTGSTLSAQDTTRSAVTLPAVSIIQTNTRPETIKAQTPTQVASSEKMEQLGDAQLSDVLRRMVGVTLKDYGGIGGIKTVSARGLGSQFSTLTIDGVAVTDCQNGQVDLGRYMLGNSSYISLSNGQVDNSLNSARAYSAGSIINMETHEPEFGIRPFNLRFGLEGGSFGLFSPTLAYERRIGRRLSLSFWGNYLRSEGNYPFTLYYTPGRTDSCSRERRENSQIRIGTADANIFYRFNSSNRLHIKAHYMKGFHALPGPVIYYTVRGSEHSEEQLFFSQARFRHKGRNLDFQLLAKYQQSQDVYADTAVYGIGTLRNDYLQREAYLSQTFRYHTGDAYRDYFSLSFSADEAANHLLSNLSKHNDVLRFSALGVLSAEYIAHLVPAFDGLRASANVLGTWIQDREQGISPVSYSRFSPYVGFNWNLKRFTFRYFFKENYRVPNFNELYYYTVGHSLRPEKALQHNVGVTYRSAPIPLKEAVAAYTSTADVYYNRVADKIVAIPMQNMFLWSMINMGKVEILGFDLTANATLQTHSAPHTRLDLSLGYSYQYAVDRTDPASKTYGHQIPYTPRHSGNATLTATTPWVDVGLSLMLVGERYAKQQNTPASRVPGYVDQGVTLSRSFDIGRTQLRAKIQVLNLFDVQYEVVKSYPMMGRNYRLGLTWII